MTDRKELAISEASAAQLREFAETILGLPIHKQSPGAAIRSKMSEAGYDKDFITVPMVIEVEATAKAGDQPVETFEWVTVLIEKSEEKGGDQPVFLSVNGRALYVERGKPQKIKVHYEEALRNACMTIYDQGDNEQIPREVPRFAYRILQNAA